MTAAAPRPAAEAVIEAFRNERLRTGLRCPHCASTAVIRWGSFSGRCRYRCSTCRHTFSDLTGTAVANLKRIDLWRGFCVGVEETETLRAAARRLGVHLSTTFRWRHRLVGSLQKTDRRRLGGEVTIGTSFLKYSEKGSRSARPAPPPRSEAWMFGFLAVRLVVACGEGGVVVTEPVGLRRPTLLDLRRIVLPRLDAAATLVSREGRFGSVATLAAGMKRRWRQVGPSGLQHPGGSPAHAYAWRFRRWLRRFRGVATRYLPGYLAWHRCDELVARSGLGLLDDLILGRYPGSAVFEGAVDRHAATGRLRAATSGTPSRQLGGA